MRVCKYYDGDGYERRQIKPYLDAPGEVGDLHLQIFLRGVEHTEGGRLAFLPGIGGRREDACLVSPTSGEVVVFQGDIAHEMPPIIAGFVCVINTTVMYRQA